MKTKRIFLFCAAFVLCFQTFAQDCDKLLEGGLYSFTNMTNTGSFSSDLRTYYLSEQFKTDMKSGKWGGSLTIPVEGVPISLGANFSDDQYSEFRNKVLQTTQFSIKSDFFKTSFSTMPNTNLYQAYVECQRIYSDVSKTGFIQGTNIETENTVVFAIYYRKQAPNDPMPIVKSFNVEPAGSVISGNLIAGQKLNTFSLLVTCKRDQDKDLILSLQTDRGLLVSKSVAEGSYTSSSNVPIGTVITSFLSFDQFSAATKNNEKSPGSIWTSAKSKWAPCDGRPIPTSKYSTFASQPNAPDLRGVFLRGLNSFDPAYTVGPSIPQQLNPDSNPLGGFQDEAFKVHNHGGFNSGGGSSGPRSAYSIDTNVEGRWEKANVGGNETRPKNLSIYYYIKIN
jgi:hypothetical protein